MFKGNSEKMSATSLKGLGSATDSTLRPYSLLVSHNLGNLGLIASVPMHQFYQMSAVANEGGLAEAGFEGSPIAQRKLDPKHAFKLAVYMLRGLIDAHYKEIVEVGGEVPFELERLRSDLGKQPYFALQPIVANLRSCGPSGEDLKVEEIGPGYVKVYLSDRDTLWVIDGQHRRYGMDLLFDFLEFVLKNYAYPKRTAALYRPVEEDGMTTSEIAIWRRIFELARSKCTVLLDIHLGLDPEQERQLFHDLNNLGKRVEAGLAFEFDTSNPINLFIKEELIGKGILHCRVVDKDKPSWQEDEGEIARKDLVAITARLLLNKTTVSGAKPQEIAGKLEVAKEFWEAVSGIPDFGEPGAKRKTVAAQPVVLLALAKLAYDFAFGRDANGELLEKLIQGISILDFSHENPMWRYYQMSEEERKRKDLNGLADFLPSDEAEANRDIGVWDESEQLVRFGVKRNDIFPVLADMIRWKLGLPSRRKAELAVG